MILILLDLHLFPGSGPENLSSDMNPPAFYELRQLPKLTQVEEMLIAMAIPVMQVFRIKGGNLGYRKNVLTIQQEFTIESPRTTESLGDHVLVILKRCVNRNDQSIFESKFRVTGASCQGWIHFLTRQHRQYVTQVQVHDGNLRQIEGSQKNLLALATVQRNITNVTSAAEGEDAGNESNDAAFIAVRLDHVGRVEA